MLFLFIYISIQIVEYCGTNCGNRRNVNEHTNSSRKGEINVERNPLCKKARFTQKKVPTMCWMMKKVLRSKKKGKRFFSKPELEI